MRNLRTLAVAAAAAAALVLSACGVPGGASNVGQTLKVSSTLRGPVDLLTFDPSLAPIGLLPIGSPRSLPMGTNGKAVASLYAAYDGGNWNVTGTWKDAGVQMKFKGFAIEAALTNQPSGGDVLRSQADFRAAAAPLQTATGGVCIPVLTHYESLNAELPGTGYAVITLCDEPTSTTIGLPPPLGWTGPDYVKVYVPSAQTGDLNPFGNYLSGGQMAAGGSISNSISVTTATEIYTPTPTFPNPCYTGPAPTSTSMPNPWPSCDTVAPDNTSVRYSGPASVAVGTRFTLSGSVVPDNCPSALEYALDRNPVTGAAGIYRLPRATVAAANWRPGSYVVTVTYPGDTRCTSASGSGALTVTKASVPLAVSALPTSTTLPASGSTTVVSRITTPGTVSVSVKGAPLGLARSGDSRYVTYTVNATTGAVTVRTYGYRGVTVKVTVTSSPNSRYPATSYTASTWTRSWVTG